MKVIPARAAKRAYDKFVPDTNGCYISTYSVASHGYAQVGWKVDGSTKNDGTTAHRAAWTHVHGQIPERMDIDHICRNHRCVNVDHLRLLSPEENRRRCKADFPIGENCRRGHPPEARRKTERGMVCQMCDTDRVREFYERKRVKKAAA